MPPSPALTRNCVVSISLLLSYLLIVLLCAPFSIRRAEASVSGPTKIALATAAARPVPQTKAARREGELLVRFKQGASEQDKNIAAESKGAHRGTQLRGESNIEKLSLSAGQDADAVADSLRLDPSVELAEPNYLVAKDEIIPDDPQFGDQWALRNTGQNGGTYGSDIGITVPWDKTTGSSDTVVAVIDSGIDFSHPDLAGNEWTNPSVGTGTDLHGWDYITNSGVIKDEQGHGTAIAGIIGAEGNNQQGIAGVMWKASLMSLRVLDNTGTGDVAKAIEAIDYAVSHGAQVINLSWGTDGQSLSLKDAIDRAGQKGVVVVCSAGNNGRDIESTPYYPASFDSTNLVAVAGTDNRDQLTSWSNWGSKHIKVGAPGTDIVTTQMGGGYWSVTGTSASAPLVTGLAGLIKTMSPKAGAKAIVAAIQNGARQVGSLTGKVASNGVVSAAGAFSERNGAGGDSGDGGNDGNGGNGNGNGNGGNGGGDKDKSGHTPLFDDSDGKQRHGSKGTPPTPSTGAPGPNLPNLDQMRKLQPAVPGAATTIHSDLMCLDCGGDGGGRGAGGTDPYYGRARTKPQNQTGQAGVTPGSQNFNWGLLLVSLKGRAGLDLDLGLTYNSLVWTSQDSGIQYNADRSFPSPGFHLGFPILQQRFYDSQSQGGVWAYMMVTSAGGRVEMQQIGSSNTYQSYAGDYTQLIDNTGSGGGIVVMSTDGTHYYFTASVNNEFRCTKIEDRNGNIISASYDGLGHMTSVVDTVGRTIVFNYDSSTNNLTSITQPGVANPAATFAYGSLTIQYNFTGLNVVWPANNTVLPVLNRVTLADSSYYAFDYTNWGQVWEVEHYAADGHRLAYTAINLPGSPMLATSAQTDCPRFSEEHDFAENWINNAEAVTYYSINNSASWTKPEDQSSQSGALSQVTTPDGTVYKTYFHSSGWDNGLPQLEQTFSSDDLNNPKRWVSTTWTQDNTGVGYQVNPRTAETNIYDPYNHKRTTYGYYDYYLGNGARRSLLADITERR